MKLTLPPLTVAEKHALLDLARRSIRSALACARSPEAPRGHPRLEVPQGAFVTLMQSERLRGCIGILEAPRALWETVTHCAAAAAFEDPRFPPLVASEIDALRIEITALQPPFRPGGPGEIVLGRHGLLVSRGVKRGVLLPQVALEHGFDVPAFIRETLRKAGLPTDALERGEATLSAFEAENFFEA